MTVVDEPRSDAITPPARGDVPDYIETNRANWDSRVPFHEQGYGLDDFRTDPAHLSDVVRFDLPRLGDVAGLTGVHLQCHIGTDTLSLARLGARMTGLDFSAPALDVARRLAADCSVEIDYVESDLYGAVDALGGRSFDFVFTGIGALCWLPDVRRWAQVVSALLRPGGFLFIREGHPMLWTLADPRPDGLVVVEFPYFETAEGTVFHETTTYVEHEGELPSPMTISFNHGLGEIITAVADAGLRVVLFDEHDSVPWNPLGDAMVIDDRGEYRLRERPERLAASYTLRAVKEGSGTLT
jgi:SAM-dependent methyltransferase